MSIEQLDVIDFISVNKAEKEVILTISDNLDWGEPQEDHLFLLQEKINLYLQFIESGELADTYSDSIGCTPVISVIGKYPLPENVLSFTTQFKKIVEDAGVGLKFEMLSQ